MSALNRSPSPGGESADEVAEEIFSPDLLRLRAGSVLCWMATVDDKGMPNVSPKEIFCMHGERDLLIANIASPQSVRNVENNPNVCVSFADVLIQKGYKLKGIAEVVAPGHPQFAELVSPLQEMTRGSFEIHSVIRVQVHATELILAPSYRLKPGTTEESQALSAQSAYQWPRT